MLAAIHGLTENDLVWRRALEPLRLEMSCPLLPGHGGMPCPEGTTTATVAAECARKFGQCIDLVGYSMGGRIALRWAADFPEQIRRLVVIGSHPGIRDAAARATRKNADDLLAAMLDEDGIGAFVARWEQHPTLTPRHPLPEAEVERLRSQRLSHDPRGLAAAIRMLGAGTMEPIWERLPKMPALLIVGANDDKFRVEMEQMANLMPKASLLVVADAGHAVHREQPAAMIAAIAEFLAG